MDCIERLRALEKAVELVEKATPGPWQQVGSTHSYGIGGDFTPGAFSLVAGGTSGKDCDAVVAAVNFIREHGSALIAELGQEVGAVAWMPIDSAPRDGSWIVLANAANGKSATAKSAGQEFKTLPEYEWIQWPYINGQPTHWTHCPKETT